MRRWYGTIGIAALAALVVAGASALAASHFGAGHHGFWKQRISAHIDEVLAAAKASPDQRTLVHAARDHVFDTMQANQNGHAADFKQALALFAADRIDPAQVQALRARHQAAMKSTGDAIVQALTDAHDAFTAAQRQAVVAYLKSHRPDAQMGEWHLAMGKRMVTARVDGALDVLKASDAQRSAIHASVDRAVAAVEQVHKQHQADRDTGLALFAADRIDASKLAALRAQRESEITNAGDAIVRAVTEVHDTLTAAQRQQLVAFLQAHHRHFGEGAPK